MNGAPERVAENAWLVRASLGAGSVCLYVVRGDKLALIDTGYSNHPGEALEPALRSLGLRLDEVDLILNTHGHADHLGGNEAVKAASGAAVHLHRDDLAMSHGPAALLESPYEMLATLKRLGWQDQAHEREALLRRRVGRDVGVDRVLEDGDRVDLSGGVRFRVVHTPGHTPGSVTFLDEERGVAFVGDAVRGWGGPPGGLPFYQQPAAYPATLDRLLSLPIATMCMGHPNRWSGEAGVGQPVRSGPAVERTLRDSREFIPAIEDAVRAALAAGIDREEDLVLRVVETLPAPFGLERTPDGRVPGFAAATILAYLDAAR